MRATHLVVAAALALAVGCGRAPQSRPPADSGDSAAPSAAVAPSADSAAMTGITGREWTLVSLGEDDGPLEETARPVTLRLDESSGRATGYGGCNSYGGPFTLSGASLSFGPIAMTRMACRVGMATEQRYAEALTTVARYRLESSRLVLLDAGGKTVATFEAR